MAGDIWITEDVRWPVNYSLYNWVLDFFIERTTDPEALVTLEEIRENNLGLVYLEGFPPPVREQMTALLANDLMPDAHQRVPQDMDGREGYLEALQELAALAQQHQSTTNT